MSIFALANPCPGISGSACTGLTDRWVAYCCTNLHVRCCRTCQDCYLAIRSRLLGRRCDSCALVIEEMCMRDNAGIDAWDSAWEIVRDRFTGLSSALSPGSVPCVSQAMSPVISTGMLAPASTSEAKTRGFIKL